MAFSLGGFLCKHGFDNGWPSVFYTFGLIGVIWSFFWFIFASDSPSENRFIKRAEVDFIETETLKLIGPNLKPNRVNF